jgi:serine protease Do
MLRRSMPGLAALAAAILALATLQSALADTRAAPGSRELIHLSFAPVVKKAAPAVVNVFSRRVVKTQSPFFNDPLFRRFFGGTPFGLPQERVQNSLGSGVIVDASGLIVTNHHVIQDADEVTVVLADRREFDAKILLSDERTDMAVLKIDAHGEHLPTVEIGDSDQLEVGDLVLAIGDPFGVGQTVTSGIVSGLARTAVGLSDIGSFIQTDAPINPGNSGGALLDLDGKLVGINTAIFSQSGGSIGIGFAIPAAMVRIAIQAAKSGGHISRPWFGASGQAVTAEIASGLGLDRPSGVLIKDIAPDSPASRSGVHIGEVILDIDGHEVEDPEGLRYRIATAPPGTTVRLTMWHNGQTRKVAAELTLPPDTPARDITEITGRNPLAGAVVGNLNPAFDEELSLDPITRGVVVSKVREGTAAERLGLQPGDVIANISHHEIESVTQLQSLLASSSGPWIVAIMRNGQRISVTVR